MYLTSGVLFIFSCVTHLYVPKSYRQKYKLYKLAPPGVASLAGKGATILNAHSSSRLIKLLFMVIFAHDHSVLKLFTGFINAALMALKLTVISAIASAEIPATANTHQLISMR